MNLKLQRGFTLIEVMMVAGITVFITGVLVQNFSRSRVDLNQTVLTVVDAIREAQSQAVAGLLFEDTYRCGYGIHFDAASYVVYAGPDAAGIDCATENKNFDDQDSVVRQGFLSNTTLEFVLPVLDIFFEPPNPTTYIGNSSAPGTSAYIVIRRKNSGPSQESGTCSSKNCRSISVSTSGQIESQ